MRDTVSVGVLADFACRSGDLEAGGVAGVTARQGQQAHQLIQARETALDPALASEVKVVRVCTVDGTPVTLTGRIDLCSTDRRALVEIKTTRVPAERIPASRQALHWAQAMLYAFCISDGGSVELELLYVDVLAQRETRRTRTISSGELADFADRALTLWLRWYRRIGELRTRTVASAISVGFPFGDYRGGQRELAIAAFRGIRDAQHLLCEAPTGIGKSISTLYPAIKAIGAVHISQIICLTAKTSGADATVQALRQMQDSGLRVTAVVLRARQRSCFCARGLVERDTDGICPMTLGFHDRLPDARIELIERGIADGATLDEVAWNHQVCPFELGLKLLPWVTVAVGDYAYVFDPLARLAHFAESPGAMALLIDEAHNLPDRARGMYTAQIDERECEAAVQACLGRYPALTRAIRSVLRAVRAQVRGLSEPVVAREEAPLPVARAVARLVEQLGEAMSQGGRLPERVMTLWQGALRYRLISEQFGTNHRALLSDEMRNACVRLVCLDASKALSRDYRQFRAVILFSGTLRPFEFHQRVLGLPKATRRLSLDSPFDTRRALHLSVPWIDTRFRARQRSEADLVILLGDVLTRRQGNYLAFFPSHRYLQQVLDAFKVRFPQVETWHQMPGMGAAEREALLARLSVPGHRLGFAIMGGLLGEGVDYPGDALIGVVIVGTGLPAVNLEQTLLGEHFARAGFDGYDHAYRYPGLIRLMQAAGRLIRRNDDRGVVVLVDHRLQQPFYRRLLPTYWNVQHVSCKARLTESLEDFWCTSMPVNWRD